MTPERWEQIKRIFHEAIELESAQRESFLAQAFGQDSSLREQVEALIESHEEAGDFIETPASDLAASLLAQEHSALVPGDVLGPFTIKTVLAKGGMGQVYLAEDTRLGRPVALKLLPTQFTADPDRVRRFEQEARAASALNHPNIVTIHEIGQADSLHFIATEFVDGQTLREHLKNKSMTVGEVLEVGAQIATALAAAHQAGIVHRDIKPENIMVRPDHVVKVLDFGLAKLMSTQLLSVGAREAMVQTNPGVVMGTAAYMSPEQARGDDVDARTDVWSFGVVLYEMVTGRAPFTGETPSHVIVSVLESKPTPLSVDPEVPQELDRIVAKALCKKKIERYQTAGDIALDLKHLKEELTIEARLKQFQMPAFVKTSLGHEQVTARAKAASTKEIFDGRAMSSAEYLLNGIQRHRGTAVLAALVVLLLTGSLVYFVKFKAQGGEQLPLLSNDAASRVIDSMAVLQFVNESGNSEYEYLGEGLSDSLINSLSQLPNLRVISLNAVSRYKGQQVDLQSVGRELNVRAVLGGKVIQRGNSLTISAELVDVRDGSRLWGAQYNRKPSELLAIRSEIINEISAKVRPRPSGSQPELLTKQQTQNPAAYAAYLKGQVMFEKRTAAAIAKSIEYLEEAVRLDPNYAPAYAALSYAYYSSRNFDVFPSDEAIPKAKAAAAKALELDDTVAETYTALGHIKQTEWDWEGAGSAFQRAVQLNPNSAFARSNYAFHFIAMKRFDEAVAESKRAVELKPTSVLFNRNAGMMLYYARRYDEAIEQCRQTLELDPNMQTAYAWLAYAYEQKGLYDQAVDALLKAREIGGADSERLKTLREAYSVAGWNGFWRAYLVWMKEQAKQRQVSPYRFAEVYVRLGDKDQTFASLEGAYAEHRAGYSLVADPLWDDLRSDPRFTDLVRRIGLKP